MEGYIVMCLLFNFLVVDYFIYNNYQCKKLLSLKHSVRVT